LLPVIGTALEFVTADRSVRRRLYVSGDTLLVKEPKEIPMRFDSVHAGVQHSGGATLPTWRRLPLGLTVTVNGRQGAELAAMPALQEDDPGPLRRLPRFRVATGRLHRGDVAPRHR
jgi:hypothetical protein